MTAGTDALRLFSFYLPQFHPTPENDTNWGKGFTEWTNVAKARPLFPGHYQPHLPADLGFYDLRLPEARQAQADLARSYGVTGFCYYHYWFNGRKLLDRPFNEVLASGEPDLPFLLCWANENWTRVWDGGQNDVLIAQEYGDNDDRAHIRSLLPAFADPRYATYESRPMFLVYRSDLLPDSTRTTDTWRGEVTGAGLPEPYLVRVESMGRSWSSPELDGFDAAVEFIPDASLGFPLLRKGLPWRVAQKINLISKAWWRNSIASYDDVAAAAMARPTPSYRRFPCVTPGWDNTARRPKGEAGVVYDGSTPDTYGRWLRQAIEREMAGPAREKVVFINGWNEWAEGNHLEPCQRWGRAYLEATLAAVTDAEG